MPANHKSVAEAASRLGVNQARVRAMIAGSLLDAVKVGGRWLIAPESIDRYMSRARPVGRPFTALNAWGLLMVAAGERPGWLSPSDMSRIRRCLREQGLVELVPRLRRRAVLHRFRAHPSDTNRISSDKNVILTGISAANHHDLEIVAPGQVEIYTPARNFQRLKKKYALQPSERSNLLVRTVESFWPFGEADKVAPQPVVGVDLLDSDDARSRRVGKRILEQVEAQWLT